MINHSKSPKITLNPHDHHYIITLNHPEIYYPYNHYRFHHNIMNHSKSSPTHPYKHHKYHHEYHKKSSFTTPHLHLTPSPQDTAEYGLGMVLGSQQRREKLVEDVKELLEEAMTAVECYG